MNRMIALVVLIVLMPLFLLIYIAVYINSAGGGIYTQERIGRKGIPFLILKFRTMYSSATRNTLILLKSGDRRITPVGRFLRRFKLDELPQLVNIIRGQMNWFGPRPEQAYFVRQIIATDNSLATVYNVTPGLISLGVLRCGYATDLAGMCIRARYDRYFLKYRTTALCSCMFWNTIVIIVKGNNI